MRNDHPGRHLLLHRIHLLSCLVVFGTGVFTQSMYCAPILFALMLGGLFLRSPDAFLTGVVCGLASSFWRVGLLRELWPLPIALALAAAMAVGALWKFTRGELTWVRKGDWGRRQVAIVAVVAIVSGVALVSWYLLVKPDILDLTRKLPRVSPVALLAIGLVFSISNAICEEFLWRGMIYNALERAFPSGAAVICIQAISFGFAHIHGFPRGASGIFLAGIYGVMLGMVRRHAGGMLAPVTAHVFADLVIYAILATVVFADKV